MGPFYHHKRLCDRIFGNISFPSGPHPSVRSLKARNRHSTTEARNNQGVPKSCRSWFFSRYFLVPKRDDSFRPILDLRHLNKFIAYRRFRMVTLERILPLLQQGDWFVVIDLSDAYFHINIRHDHCCFLRFSLGSKCYEFSALPFGLSTAPRVFTKCMAPVAAFLRTRGIAVFPYTVSYTHLTLPTKA